MMDKKSYLEEAKKLINLPQSCMKKEDTSVMLLLHPKHTTNVKKGIIEELDAMLQRYSETLNGIPMAYENIKLLSNYGVLLHDNAFTHVHVSATFYVFTPEVGSELQGVACKKSKNIIGFLVYNKFNVSATCPDGVSIANWCGSRVQEQDEVKITITYLNMKGYAPTIKVQINPDSIPEHTSSSMGITTNTENKRIVFNDDDSGISSNDTPVTEVKKKKKKSRIEDKSDIKKEDDDLSSEDDIREKKKKLKKTLFKTIVSENSDIDVSLESKDFLTPDSVLDSPTKKKKKKRKSILEDSLDSSAMKKERDDSFRNECDGSFLSSPSKKNKRDKVIKIKSGSPAIDLDNDSTFKSPMRNIKKENLESPELDLNDSVSSSGKKKKKKDKNKDRSFLIGDLDNNTSMTTPILDLSLAHKKKKDKKRKDHSCIDNVDTPKIKKELEMSLSKSDKKVGKSLNNDDFLEDLPFDFDDDIFKNPPTEVTKSKKNKSETPQYPQIRDKKRKAEETPDGSTSKKKRKL
ncbi:unnamed protein product [Meganyctiphanes norvegica]|uniref:DNA-directed RNA polymerase I subunit RPA43 n=1 Tax=Meganyctiphanes norvegica TaxID=48144 RepID=A0AAV2RSX1_MEGNR